MSRGGSWPPHRIRELVMDGLRSTEALLILKEVRHVLPAVNGLLAGGGVSRGSVKAIASRARLNHRNIAKVRINIGYFLHFLPGSCDIYPLIMRQASRALIHRRR